MALTLGQSAQLVASAAFNARVRAAMVRAAMTVANESSTAVSGMTPEGWAKRQQLATRILTSPDAMLPAFVAAVAADPGSSFTWFLPMRITSSTNANPSMVTTAAVHGLSVGDVVEIAGHLVNTDINGTWTVATVPTTTTFSVPQAANGAGTATGTVQKTLTDVEINYTVNSSAASNVFSAIADLSHVQKGQT